MKILWFTWKDLTHPKAGGAEVVNEELAKRLVKEGHEVIFVVGGYKGAAIEEWVNGYKVVRLGNRWTVYFHAWRYYKKHLMGWADLVIDEVNTMPFFAGFYAKEPVVMFYHMLCRKIWFYQMPKLIGAFGYILEPLYLRLMRGHTAITVSESTKQDLVRHGYNPGNIHIISEGIITKPLEDIMKIEKYDQPTLLSFGSVRPMKRTLDQVKAFELAKQKVHNLKLIVAGDIEGEYGRRVLEYIGSSPHRKDIEVTGKVDAQRKATLLQKAHLTLVTSVKEGWGLVVTEANSQGTPAVVYDVDGLRDAVKHEQTGVVCEESPQSMAKHIVSLLKDSKRYNKFRSAAHTLSHTITFDRSHADFKRILEI